MAGQDSVKIKMCTRSIHCAISIHFPDVVNETWWFGRGPSMGKGMYGNCSKL